MKHRQVEAFHSIMISGSAVRAAELMGITQPAVSRLISELEAELKFPLFDRIRGRLVATPEAQLFHREVEASFTGLDRLRTAAARIRDYGEGTLRIGCFSAGSGTIVPAAIRNFRKTNPKVRITLHITWSSAIRNGVIDGQYDIGLAADEIDRSGVDTQLFGNFMGAIAMRRGHPLSIHEEISPELLAGQQLIGLVPEDRARHRFDAALAASNVEPDYVVETPNSVTVCALALSGDAIGLVNPLVTDGFQDTLIFKPFVPQINFRSYIIYPPGSQKSQLMKAFTACLMEQRNKFSTTYFQ
ncbi:LysR family transcriptional regulator [Ahrensia kielensis]|uniref:LysR family transcriptional regulator n=1 Tax=Ahrensia kielensis TaxID=76980 RepID=UPI00039D691F|nr:LysR family transcriptional regulator [Ahrensia kielensis]